MPRVTLSTMYRPGDVLFFPGDTVEVDEDTAARLKACGSLVTDRPAEAEPVAPQKVDATPDPVVDEEPVESGPVKPKRAASVDAWRTYAEAQGVDVKGMSKQEIIAATR